MAAFKRWLTLGWVAIATAGSIATAHAGPLAFHAFEEEHCPSFVHQALTPDYFGKEHRDSLYTAMEIFRLSFQGLLEALEKNSDPLISNRGFCVGFYDDSNSPNAFARPGNDLGFLFGLNFVNDIIKDYGDSADGATVVKAVVAHEFGHIIQYILESTDKKKQESYRYETHADCFSGAIMGSLQGNPKPGTLDLLKRFARSIGTHSRNDPHGTPQERQEAMEIGYKIGQSYRSSERTPLRTSKTLAEECFKYYGGS